MDYEQRSKSNPGGRSAAQQRVAERNAEIAGKQAQLKREAAERREKKLEGR